MLISCKLFKFARYENTYFFSVDQYELVASYSVLGDMVWIMQDAEALWSHLAILHGKSTFIAPWQERFLMPHFFLTVFHSYNLPAATSVLTEFWILRWTSHRCTNKSLLRDIPNLKAQSWP